MWRSCAATAAQPTAFLLAKDIQGARTQPPRIAFACPRKLDDQLRGEIVSNCGRNDTVNDGCFRVILRSPVAISGEVRCGAKEPLGLG